ncbi:3-isopropylmalate dehydrogenase [Acaryochloris thomasi RCC1774]|uniref:3-isopropylmalate dehydrogenase n=1 Tax=Acaryochloris thomasi RCC1774 TaxID=1764569 RepID=A0A2W1JGT7_9CYAN|nr:3-isopropylmalate dehydrogenase [Acaryochloris thomasi]PZD72779.1 3-isopropylmalate dehydrogenase [Acaryochloris thomasi RCC1774]
MGRQYRVAVLPGEGIGPEVVDAALKILYLLADLEGFEIQGDYGLIGLPAQEKLGSFFPETTAQLCQGSDGIVFGAVSRGGLLELRQHFDFFMNLRPVRSHPHLFHKSPLKPELLQDVDILFVRELASGLYFGPAGRATDGSYGYHTMRYNDSEIRRIAKVALQKAQERRGHLTVAHKENALPQIPWCRLVQEMAQDFPDITVEPVLVDNLAMQLVMHPQDFDVILAGNLFGDILSDLGGAIAGSIGLLGSASFNERGLGLYEPVHGTAPDIAGKGIGNPLGMISSLTMMLQHWGEHAAASRLAQVQNQILEQGYRTADLYTKNPQEKKVSTQDLTSLFCKRL